MIADLGASDAEPVLVGPSDRQGTVDGEGGQSGGLERVSRRPSADEKGAQRSPITLEEHTLPEMQPHLCRR